MIDKFWNKFNIVTKDHFYRYSGGKAENRQSVIEALICNFDVQDIKNHNHKNKEKAAQVNHIGQLQLL